MHDTEDKRWWVNKWQEEEEAFVEEVCPELGLAGEINPEKRLNPYVPDLVVDGQLADLKCQTTPFFKANEMFGIDPQYAVTFNEKDHDNYRENYPHVIIYYWVRWLQTEKTLRGTTYQVEPMEGVWRLPFLRMAEMISAGEVKPWAYKRRRNDTQGNAKVSYVFDLRDFERLKLEWLS